MDTGTHIVMGVAIGGIATLDPVVTESSVTATSVIIATIVGSQIPDIDTVLKLKSNAIYIRNHRGITHSIPAVILWPMLIVGTVYLFQPEVNLTHLWMWTQLAVFLHVFVDIFNAYGTQALRPFSSKWLALGIINTFDPFIFILHVAAIILWVFGASPGYLFLGMYAVIVAYYIHRFVLKRKLLKIVNDMIPDATEVIIAPTMRNSEWRIAVMNDHQFFVGRAKGLTVTILDQFNRIPVPETAVLTAAMEDHNLAAFLSFSPVYRWEMDEYDDHFEVRFIDLRYRSNGHYPFVAVVKLDKNHEILSSYTGWIYSEEKLQKKLEVIPN